LIFGELIPFFFGVTRDPIDFIKEGCSYEGGSSNFSLFLSVIANLSVEELKYNGFGGFYFRKSFGNDGSRISG